MNLILLFALWAPTTILAQTDSCQNTCGPYNDILDNCQVDADVNSAYLDCVCNDPNFQTANGACVSCEGAGSAPAKFQQNCKKVPPDCTVACSLFSQILTGCGDASGSGFANCVCGSAYDTVYTTTFNEAFTDCVTCENGGGQAADWEQTCCNQGHGCIGIDVAAGTSATLPATLTTPITTPVTTPALTTTAPVQPVSTTTPVTPVTTNNSGSGSSSPPSSGASTRSLRLFDPSGLSVEGCFAILSLISLDFVFIASS